MPSSAFHHWTSHYRGAVIPFSCSMSHMHSQTCQEYDEGWRSLFSPLHICGPMHFFFFFLTIQPPKLVFVMRGPIHCNPTITSLSLSFYIYIYIYLLLSISIDRYERERQIWSLNACFQMWLSSLFTRDFPTALHADNILFTVHIATWDSWAVFVMSSMRNNEQRVSARWVTWIFSSCRFDQVDWSRWAFWHMPQNMVGCILYHAVHFIMCLHSVN